MKKVMITLYEFNELNKTARNKALMDEYLIENIEANEYLYFFNGETADCVTHVQWAFPNPKADTTEFKLYGEIYTYGRGIK